MFLLLQENPNKDNKICPLPSSSWSQQHFQDWFYVLRNNSDLSKLEWTLLLFSFNYISGLTNSCKFFSIPISGMLPFHIRFGTLKTNIIGLTSYFLNITLKRAQFTSFSYLHMYESMVWQPTQNLQSSFY